MLGVLWLAARCYCVEINLYKILKCGYVKGKNKRERVGLRG